MKTLRLIIMCAVMTLAAVSCEFPFSLENNSSPEIYFQCVVSNADSTLLKIRYAAPAYGNSKSVVDFHPTAVRFSVNGASAPVSAQGDSLFCVYHSFTPGEKLKAEVEAAGMHPVSASTVVPALPKVRDVRVSPFMQDDKLMYQVVLFMDGEVAQDEFYGLQIEQRTVTSKKTEDTFISAGQIATAADVATLDLDAFAQINYDGAFIPSRERRPMMLLTERLFEKDAYSFYINSFSMADIAGSMGAPPVPGDGEDDGGGEEPEKVLSKSFRLYVYRLSDEAFHYSKAQYLLMFNMLSNFGLTPPNFTYSNVAGGLGVFCSLSCVVTGWKELPLA